MATSLSMSAQSGYPTKTQMKVTVSFSVTYSGSYYVYFEVHKTSTSGTIVYTASGSTYTLDAGGSKRNLKKTIPLDGGEFASGTTYYIVASLWNASTDTRLSISEPSVKFTTLDEYSQKITYYSGSSSKTQTIQGDGTLYDGFNAPSGFTFVGWAKKVNTTSVSYEGGESYSPTTSRPMSLYAVFSGSTSITCYYGLNMTSTNSRAAETYAYNTSTTSRTTEITGSITLPSFNPSTLSVLSRTFTGIGWRSDTEAASQTCNPGTTITPTSDVYYAVYDNNDGIKVTYDSNGGSGTMASATVSGTLYYNTAGNNTTITVNPRDCTFTPPKGKSFAGWSTSANGDIVTAISTAYNVTLYAIWQSSLPAIWTWSSAIGGTLELTPTGDNTYDVYPLTAIEWNNFLSRIEEWVDVLGTTLWVSDIQVATATKGSGMKASQAQAVVRLLKNLNPPTSPPNAPSSGGAITASFINGLATSLNSLRSLYA